jgi:hypothetical protein
MNKTSVKLILAAAILTAGASAFAGKPSGGGGGGGTTLQATQISGTYRVIGFSHCFSVARDSETDFLKIKMMGTSIPGAPFRVQIDSATVSSKQHQGISIININQDTRTREIREWENHGINLTPIDPAGYNNSGKAYLDVPDLNRESPPTVFEIDSQNDRLIFRKDSTKVTTYIRSYISSYDELSYSTNPSEDGQLAYEISTSDNGQTIRYHLPNSFGNIAHGKTRNFNPDGSLVGTNFWSSICKSTYHGVRISKN